MTRFTVRLTILSALISTVFIATATNGLAENRGSVRNRLVDVVLLKDGTRLAGTIINHEKDVFVDLLIRGDWLRQNAPDIATQLTDSVDSSSSPSQPQSAIDIIKHEMERLRAEPSSSIEHLGYLQERLAKLGSTAKLESTESPAPDVYLIRIDASQIRRQLMQPKSRRTAAGVAILNNLEGVEQMSAMEATSKLKQLPAPLQTTIPEPDDAVDIATQVLLDADRAFGKQVRLIRIGNRFIVNDEHQQVAALVPQLLSDGLGAQLQSLLDEASGIKKNQALSTMTTPRRGDPLPQNAARSAGVQAADVVEISAMNVDLQQQSATVTIDLYRRQRNPDSEPRFVLRATGRAAANEVSADRIDRIANDPRVKEVRQLAGILGADANLGTALAMGAVVEKALENAEASLQSQLTLSPSAGLVVHRSILRSDADQPQTAE